jgi:hypothetical protein
MKNSKYNEIYDDYNTSSSKSVIDCVSAALHTSLKTLRRDGNNGSSYRGKVDDLHQLAIEVQDLAEFISEYYYRNKVICTQYLEVFDEKTDRLFKIPLDDDFSYGAILKEIHIETNRRVTEILGDPY